MPTLCLVEVTKLRNEVVDGHQHYFQQKVKTSHFVKGEIWQEGADLYPLLRAKFHLNRCDVSPPNWPVSKNNTSRAALRADPPVKSPKHHTSSSHADMCQSISTIFCMMIDDLRATAMIAPP